MKSLDPDLLKKVEELISIAKTKDPGAIYTLRTLLGPPVPIKISLTPEGTAEHYLKTPPAGVVLIITFPHHDGGRPGLQEEP